MAGFSESKLKRGVNGASSVWVWALNLAPTETAMDWELMLRFMMGLGRRVDAVYPILAITGFFVSTAPTLFSYLVFDCLLLE